MWRHADHDYITVLLRVNASLHATVDEQAAHIASQDQSIATQAQTRQILDEHTAYLTAVIVRLWDRVNALERENRSLRDGLLWFAQGVSDETLRYWTEGHGTIDNWETQRMQFEYARILALRREAE